MLLAQYDYDTGGAGLAGGVLLLIWLGVFLFTLLISVKIAMKAGYSTRWGVLALVPFVGFVVLILFAFVEWPIHRELEDLRNRYLETPSGLYPPDQPPHGHLPPSVI